MKNTGKPDLMGIDDEIGLYDFVPAAFL